MVRVTDDGEPPLSATNVFTIVVDSVNQAPVFNPIGEVSTDELVLLQLMLTATDADLPADLLFFSLVSGPEGLTVAGDGLLSWTPTEAQGPLTHVVTVRVTDDGEPPLSATNAFTIAVREINLPPGFDPVEDSTIPRLVPFGLALSASDPDLPVNALSYSLVSGPDGLSVSADGLLTWTPAAEQSPSTHEVRVRVTDNGAP